jgi:carboxymethylenebutenolidase
VTTPTGTYQSGGKSIPYDRYPPQTSGKHPAIILVHGSDGMQYGILNVWYRGYAQALQQAGYDVFVVHYFDRTDTKSTNRIGMVRNFLPWVQTIKDAVTFVSQQPDVDPQRIGLLGFSLGSTLSLSLASRDTRIAVLVEYFGGLPGLAAATMQRMPPTLILHGDKDPLVPVQEAYKLEAVLKQKQIPYEMKIYPGQGHGFRGEAKKDALQRTIIFFDQYLRH